MSQRWYKVEDVGAFLRAGRRTSGTHAFSKRAI